MRWLATAAVLALASPGVAAAQGQSPIPDQWLTIDALAGQLGLSTAQRAGVEAPLAEVNAALRRATQRRDELLIEFRGTPRVSQMSDGERRALEQRLQAVRADYEARQAEIDQWLGAIRAQLSAAQQTSFDALPKPRVVPVAGARP
jgi:hypothetical protein